MNVISTLSGVSPIRVALLAHSNAVVSSSAEGTLVQYSNIPVVATYPTVRSTVRLNFLDATGSTAHLYLPAPQNNIFLADQMTVDPATIADIIAAAIGNLAAGSGNAVTMFQGGELVATKFSGIASLQVFQP